NPVDFAGRMVYNENGEEVINFGKHKGKTVESIFDSEPSYYAWMKQGDFPLYTKKKLDEIWARWSKRKDEQRQAKAVKQVPIQERRQEVPKQKEKPAAVVTVDMLEQLKMKFGK
ncbi:MAG: DNA polymerase III subunit epsilon, partial [Bacteroidia bacterium]